MYVDAKVQKCMQKAKVYVDEDEDKDEKLVPTKEAAQCFKKCLLWMESQNSIDPVQLIQLKQMMDQATSL